MKRLALIPCALLLGGATWHVVAARRYQMEAGERRKARRRPVTGAGKTVVSQ